MDLKNIHSVYFIGIGGIGMSALARYFRFINIPVSGYDKTETPMTKELVATGISIHYTDDIGLVSKTFLDAKRTLVVYTPAVPNEHREYQYFKNNGLRLKNARRC